MAHKDPNLPTSQYSADELSSASVSRLTAFLKAIFPHRGLEDRVFAEASVDILRGGGGALVEELMAKLEVASQEQFQCDFAALSMRFKEQLLKAMQSEQLFVRSVQACAWNFYNKIELWELCGYEGAAFHLGGYAERGFDSLDIDALTLAKGK